MRILLILSMVFVFGCASKSQVEKDMEIVKWWVGKYANFENFLNKYLAGEEVTVSRADKGKCYTGKIKWGVKKVKWEESPCQKASLQLQSRS